MLRLVAPVTAQLSVLLCPLLIELGVAVKEVITGAAGGFSCTLAVTEIPESVAVTTAVSAALTLPAVAVKAALEAPDATVTEAGTGSRGLLLARPTVVVEDAAPLKVTLQLVCPPETTVEGLHVTPVSVGGGITVTVAVRVTDPPALVAVNVYVVVVVGDTVFDVSPVTDPTP